MVAVTRVHGLSVTAGNVYSHGAKGFLITVQVAGNTDVDLRAEDDAVDEAVELIIKEVNPLMYAVKDDASGEIRALGTTVEPNNVDVTGTDVIEATFLTVTG